MKTIVIGEFGEFSVSLPSLAELRAYYAALPPHEHFPVYGASSCLIARPINERRKGRLPVSIDPEDLGQGTIGIRGIANAPLPDIYNELALAFDGENGGANDGVTVNTTYGECVRLIDEVIREYGEEE